MNFTAAGIYRAVAAALGVEFLTLRLTGVTCYISNPFRRGQLFGPAVDECVKVKVVQVVVQAF